MEAISTAILTTMSLDDLLAFMLKLKGQVNAARETETNDTNLITQLTQQVQTVTGVINDRLRKFGAHISFSAEPHHIETFMLCHLNALDSVPAKNIVGCEIIQNTVHLQIVDENGKKGLRKVPKSPFIMNQIEQFRISIEANI